MKQLKKLEQVFGLQVGAVVKPSMGALGSRYRADRIFGGMYKIPADHKLLRMPDGKQSLGVMATNDDGSHAYIYLSDSLRHPIATSFIAAHEVAHLRGMHNHTDDENLREAVAVGQAVARFTPVLGRELAEETYHRIIAGFSLRKWLGKTKSRHQLVVAAFKRSKDPVMQFIGEQLAQTHDHRDEPVQESRRISGTTKPIAVTEGLEYVESLPNGRWKINIRDDGCGHINGPRR